MSLRNVLQNLHLVRSEVFRGSHFLTDDRRVPRLVPVCDLHGEERPQDRQDIPDDGWNPKRRTLEAALFLDCLYHNTCVSFVQYLQTSETPKA